MLLLSLSLCMFPSRFMHVYFISQYIFIAKGKYYIEQIQSLLATYIKHLFDHKIYFIVIAMDIT